MLPTKLKKLKTELENEQYLDQDDKKALQVLKLIDTDKKFQELINKSDFLTKSFSASPASCPVCGKSI